MDPITALSIATAAGQFVGFAFDLAKGTAERYRSIEGSEKRHLAIAENAKRIDDLLDGLSLPLYSPTSHATSLKPGATSSLAIKLNTITLECHAVARELQILLGSTGVPPSEKYRLAQSLKTTFRAMRKDSEISRLHEKLRGLRDHVDSCLIMLLWYV